MRSIVTIAVSAIVAAGVAFFIPHSTLQPVGNTQSSVQTKNETAYERIMRTGTIRCGYWTMQPMSYKDPNTGESNGFAIKLFEQLASRLSLKVDWVEEVNFSTMIPSLEANRYDAVCTGAWMSAEYARVVEATNPYLFSNAVAVVRSDDHRFDVSLTAINTPDVGITIQGAIEQRLVDEFFPKAKAQPMAEIAATNQIFTEVETKKSDVAIADTGDFLHYDENNPGKLMMIHTDQPLRVFPWVIPVRKGEHDLSTMLNSALMEMVYNGEIERIVATNGVPAGTYYYVKNSMEFK